MLETEAVGGMDVVEDNVVGDAVVMDVEDDAVDDGVWRVISR